MPLVCDDCRKVSLYLLNCYCRKMVCRECRFTRHHEHKPQPDERRAIPLRRALALVEPLPRLLQGLGKSWDSHQV